MSFINNVLALLDELDISKNYFAQKIEVNKNAIENWEKRGNVPSGDVVARIAEYFKVPVEYFLETGPFKHWDAINENRDEFVTSYLETPGAAATFNSLVYDIGTSDPYSLSIVSFTNFIDSEIEMVVPEGRGFKMTLKRPNEKTPQSSDQGDFGSKMPQVRVLSPRP